MNTVKVGARPICTHAVCTPWPSERCDPSHDAFRWQLTVIATIVTTCFKIVIVLATKCISGRDLQ